MSSTKQIFKIVLLGEGRVGKTSLVLRFVQNVFSDTQASTIQATYLQRDVKVGDNTITLSIWDTAGQEKFHALGPIYYRNADGALLVYDITDVDTFNRVKHWIKELRQVVGPNIKIAIAGNKSDLVKQRQVPEEQALEFAKKVGATHFYTSAKANKNVEEAFMDLTKNIVTARLEKGIEKKPFVLDEPKPHINQSGSGIRVVSDEPVQKPGNETCAC